MPGVGPSSFPGGASVARDQPRDLPTATIAPHERHPARQPQLRGADEPPEGMAVDTQRPTRRQILRTTLGAAAAATAAVAAGPARALAADGGPMLLGSANEASSITSLKRTSVPTADAATFFAETTISAAIVGHGTSGQGVIGRSQTSAGVQGYSDTDAGVNGFGVIGVWAAGDAVAVQGVTQVGTAGRFESAGGLALHTTGRLRLDQVSGIARIAAGGRSRTVTPGIDLQSSSFVLLTPRGNIGSRALWYTIDPTANRFTIRLSTAVASAVDIGWLLIG